MLMLFVDAVVEDAKVVRYYVCILLFLSVTELCPNHNGSKENKSFSPMSPFNAHDVEVHPTNIK